MNFVQLLGACPKEIAGIMAIVKWVITIICWIIPIILIVLVILDVAKIVTAGNIDDKLKKEVTNRIVTRVIFSVLIFLVPTIVSLLFRLVPLSDDNKNQVVSGATWSDCWEAAK
jgi:hypothetical protein